MSVENTRTEIVVLMTNLSKPVTRRATLPFLHYGRHLIVTLEPGDVLAMRLLSFNK